MEWPLVRLDSLYNIARGGSPRPIKDFITDKILRTIVAFLNTKGGTLIIGQNDDKEITGIEEDKFKNK